MKGHSERVPNKNMKLFAGKPLYHAIMKTLLDSKYIEKIIINTDSQVIAKDAQSSFKNVEIIWRPQEIQGDFVSMNKIIDYDIKHCTIEYFLQTHSTNPLLSSDTLNKAIDSYFTNLDKYDSIFSVNRLQTRLYFQDGSPVNHNPKELLRTQDLPPIFEENSNFYIFSKKSFYAAGKNRIGLTPRMFEVNKLESIDIDEPQDFKHAEIIYKAFYK
ncbi:CMP-N-acetylneuraminic acid synthetase [Candidatus Magnetomoraceae bacterium gMMP-15]